LLDIIIWTDCVFSVVLHTFQILAAVLCIGFERKNEIMNACFSLRILLLILILVKKEKRQWRMTMHIFSGAK